MSLIIAFNLNDYTILATDHKGIVGFADGHEEIELFRTDQCKKIRQVPFGFYISAGDYFITECFDIESNRKDVENRSLDQILTDTHHHFLWLPLRSLQNILCEVMNQNKRLPQPI